MAKMILRFASPKSESESLESLELELDESRGRPRESRGRPNVSI